MVCGQVAGIEIIEQMNGGYPNNGKTDPILLSIKDPNLLHHHLNEFLFLCIPRTVGDVLTDTFNNHVLTIETFTEDDKQAIYDDEELKSLYLNNIMKQLDMFIDAIGLINNYDMEILKEVNLIIGSPKIEGDVYTDIDILLITVIRITLDLKLNPTNINTLILELAQNLRVNLIGLINQYTKLCPLYNAKSKSINHIRLIELIQKVYDGIALEEREGGIKTNAYFNKIK